MTFKPRDRPPARDERFGRAEFVARGDVVLDDLVFAEAARDEVPRPGRWLARLVVVDEVRLRAVVAFLAREVLLPEVVVAEPERERLDEPPLERRRERGTVEVIG